MRAVTLYFHSLDYHRQLSISLLTHQFPLAIDCYNSVNITMLLYNHIYIVGRLLHSKSVFLFFLILLMGLFFIEHIFIYNCLLSSSSHQLHFSLNDDL